jgi:hypothetical protein
MKWREVSVVGQSLNERKWNVNKCSEVLSNRVSIIIRMQWNVKKIDAYLPLLQTHQKLVKQSSIKVPQLSKDVPWRHVAKYRYAEDIPNLRTGWHMVTITHQSLYLNTHWTGGWNCLTAFLDMVVVKAKIPAAPRNWPTVIQPMAITLLILIFHLWHTEHLGINKGDKNCKWKSDEEML